MRLSHLQDLGARDTKEEEEKSHQVLATFIMAQRSPVGCMPSSVAGATHRSGPCKLVRVITSSCISDGHGLHDHALLPPHHPGPHARSGMHARTALPTVPLLMLCMSERRNSVAEKEAIMLPHRAAGHDGAKCWTSRPAASIHKVEAAESC